MALLGAIEIELAANMARLKADMEQAKALVGGAVGQMQRAAESAKAALGGMLAGLSAAALAGWVKSAVDAADQTGKLANTIGVAARDVAGLQLAFRLGGSEAGALQTSVVQLAKRVAEGDDVFRRLGVNVRNADGTLKGTKAVLYDVADRFAGMADGVAKTALATEIFGKSGADLVPMLNDGSAGLREMAATAERLGLVIDDDTAKAAAQFNDTLDVLAQSGQGVARQLMAQLLPSLQSVAGGMLETITQGDTLRKIADGLAVALKGVFTVGVIGAEVFSTLGKVLGGVAGAIVAVVQGEFGQARTILTETAVDVRAGWANSAKAIGDVWSGAGAKVVEQGAAMSKALGGVTAQTKGEADAARKAAEALEKLHQAGEDYLQSLGKQLQVSALELVNGDKLDEAQRARLDLEDKLHAGKIALTDAQRADALAMIDAAAANREAAEAVKAHAEALSAVATHARKLADSQAAETDGMRQRNVALADEVAALTMSAAQLANREVQTLRSAAADKEWQAAMEGGNYQLEEQARLLRDRATLVEQGVAVKEAKATAEEWQRTTDQLNAGLTDALMRAFESGKGFMQAFRDTLVNAFKTLVLQPTIRAVLAPVTGAAGSLFGGGSASAATGLAGAPSAGGVSGLLSNIGGWLNGSSATNAATFGVNDLGSWLVNNTSGGLNSLGGTLMGNAGTLGSIFGGAGNAFAGYGISKALSGGYSAGGWVNALAGGASAIPGVGPLAGVIGGLVNRAFGRGPKEVTEQGITGTFGGGDFAGEAFSSWKQKGGWFRSDKSGTDKSPLDAALADALDLGAKALLDQVKTYADALGMPGDALAQVTEQIRLTFTDDAAANQSAIADALRGYQEALTAGFAAAVEPFAAEGETALDTMARLGESLAMVNPILDSLGLRLFDVSAAGGDAASQLLALFGGLEQLGQAASSYYSNFYTEAERAAKLTDALAADLAKLGLTMPDTREQFRAMVEAQDLTTESGQAAFAALLKMAGAIAELIPASESAAQALGAAADAASSIDSGSAAAVKVTASDVMAYSRAAPGLPGGALTAQQQARLDADPDWVAKQAQWGGQLPAVITGALKNFFALEEKQKAAERAKWASLPEDPRFAGLGGATLASYAGSGMSSTEADHLQALRDQIASTEDLIASLSAMSAGMRDLRATLEGSGLDPSSPEQKYLKAKAEQEALGRQAIAGDMAAADAYRAGLQDMLQASQGYNASGQAYVADWNAALTTLDAIAAKMDQLNANAQATLKVQQAGLGEVAGSSKRLETYAKSSAESERIAAQRAIE